MQPTLGKPCDKNWHTQSIDALIAALKTDADGLSATEAARRLAEHGPNELIARHRVSAARVLAEQFQNVLIVVLLIAVGLSAYLGHVVEAITITVIVLFAVVLGFIQEYRAERAIDALKQMAAPHAFVLRDGMSCEIPANEVVPGDIVLLSAGNQIPADVRLLEAHSMHSQEAALTGESVAVAKHAQDLSDDNLPVGDRCNMAFAGTIMASGRARGVVVATGMRTELGKIAQLLHSVESQRTPLQENLDKLGHSLARMALLIVVLIVLIGVFRGSPLIEMLIFGIALAVAVVPEALPAVVTISLARGVQRLIKRRALMRRLAAVETLGSTSIICSDKTGTLTRDEMTVRELFVSDQSWSLSGSGYAPKGEFSRNGVVEPPSPVLLEVLRAGALVNDAELDAEPNNGVWCIQGDPTEAALVVSAAKAGLHKRDLERRYPRVDEIIFCSERKRMSTLHQIDSDIVAYSKGAPEVILDSCNSIITHEGDAELSGAERAAILRVAAGMAEKALRVLAIARKTHATLENAEEQMCFLGLVGMIDPPRSEAKSAIETCESAGIRVLMMTGDHPSTAQAIAGELGVLKAGRVVTGTELAAMSDMQFDQEVENIDVYARVSPADKLRVVTALQKKQYVVAMTGDGVNDAPALKKADIGVAMGITGTDVAREAAAMTLTDDNFASIVAAVEEGRGIFSNIKKYLMFLLSSNVGEIGLIAGATLMGMPLPLTAVQILYVNLATDGLPALALAVDPAESDLMQRDPRNPRHGIFTRPVVTLIAVGGIWSTLVNIGVFAWALHSGRSLPDAMALTFVSLILIQFLKAYNFRSDRVSILNRPFANRWLNLAIVWELALLLLIVYLPVLHEPFGTFNLQAMDWLLVTAAAATIVPVLEAAKWMERRGLFGTME